MTYFPIESSKHFHYPTQHFHCTVADVFADSPKFENDSGTAEAERLICRSRDETVRLNGSLPRATP
jgi:hypothetical protein